MTNISWYGGASVSAQRWPLNNMNAKSQPYIISNLNKNPIGYGPVLERYFLGSTGKTNFLPITFFTIVGNTLLPHSFGREELSLLIEGRWTWTIMVIPHKVLQIHQLTEQSLGDKQT